MYSLLNKWNVLAIIIAAFILGTVFAENAGWPFLATPLEKQLSSLLNRQIKLDNAEAVHLKNVNVSANPTKQNNLKSSQLNTSQSNTSEVSKSSNVTTFRINLLGGMTIKTSGLTIAAPSWSNKPHFIDARNVVLQLRYRDVWRAYRGQPLRIKSLQATFLDGHIERKADGRASWQFSNQPKDPNKPVQLPSFDQLLLSKGFLHVQDSPLKARIEAKLSLVSNASKGNVNQVNHSKLIANATGRFKDLPLKINLVSTGELANEQDASKKMPASVTFTATVGRANLAFNGNAKDIMQLGNFSGDYKLSGPSLAAVGDLVGVTLPTTAKFSTVGTIDKDGLIWDTKIKQMAIGGSRLNGQFNYDKSLKTPLLKGQLAGKLVITDLGPAFGADAENKNPNKVLPTRPFDLKSLRKMNADVKIDMQYLDLKSSFLEPLKPLKAHLQLNNALLTLKKINASTASGQLTGDMELDGRGTKALWDANLAWKGVRLERWVKQKRAAGLPPYITGRLYGKAMLKGQGKSTAEILASLTGNIHSQLHDGSVSHLAIEVAGLDVTQSIGVMFKGDEVLPVQCAVVDLQAKNGIFRPRVMVVDTSDTTVWVDGALSLATESLNLRAMALPKDFSLLTLRVPLNVTGSFANPQVSLEKKPVGIKLAASMLMAFINPLAAVIPLMDTGDTKQANERAAGCLRLMQKN